MLPLTTADKASNGLGRLPRRFNLSRRVAVLLYPHPMHLAVFRARMLGFLAPIYLTDKIARVVLFAKSTVMRSLMTIYNIAFFLTAALTLLPFPTSNRLPLGVVGFAQAPFGYWCTAMRDRTLFCRRAVKVTVTQTTGPDIVCAVRSKAKSLVDLVGFGAPWMLLTVLTEIVGSTKRLRVYRIGAAIYATSCHSFIRLWPCRALGPTSLSCPRCGSAYVRTLGIPQ